MRIRVYQVPCAPLHSPLAFMESPGSQALSGCPLSDLVKSLSRTRLPSQASISHGMGWKGRSFLYRSLLALCLWGLCGRLTEEGLWLWVLCVDGLTGPGAYDVPAGDRGPKFSMGARASSQGGAGETPGWLLREQWEGGEGTLPLCNGRGSACLSLCFRVGSGGQRGCISGEV